MHVFSSSYSMHASPSSQDKHVILDNLLPTFGRDEVDRGLGFRG
jgi:hypothetical protein